ncbi:MAG TPA: rhomboid family intramembrane serine protease [Xanthomonadales bacterium]|nr:rhomboid family intramembrane serine protease [Xanthomonadales bacterium]
MDLPEHDLDADPAAQAHADRRRIVHAALAAAAFVALLWWIKLFEQWLGAFSALTLRPGEWWGLIGIVSAPLLHGSVAHLSANTLPMLVLTTLTLAVYPRAGLRAIPTIWLLSGIAVWLFGRPPAHLGASGLSHGLMLFLFVLGLARRERAAIATAMVAFFLYGGMLMTVFPREPGISWEYHLFGAIAGAGAGLVWRRLDPPPPRKRYSWEDEDEQTADLDHALDPTEPPRPTAVPVLWHRPEPERTGTILPFPTRSGRTDSD